MKSVAERLFLCGLVVIFFLVVQLSSLSRNADLKSLDLFQAPHPPHPSVVILAIDNKSLNEIGRWPWSRSIQSQLIEKLKGAQPQLVGMDITFSEAESPAADGALAGSLHSTSFPIVLATQAIYQKGQEAPTRLQLPLPELLGGNVTPGVVNVPLSEDGLARRFPEQATYQGKSYPPFSILEAKLLGAPAPTGEEYVRFAGPAGSFTTYSVSDVMSGKVGKDRLQDKVVLIGATASDLHDTLLAPEHPQVMAGVEYHANVLDNILLRRGVAVLPPIYAWAIGVALLLAALALMLRGSSPRWTAAIALVVVVLLPLVSYLLWHRGVALSYFQNALFVLGFLLIYGLYSWYRSEMEKRRIRETFQNYFSPSVMQAILKDPSSLKLGGRRAPVTVLFSDIRNFTTISESIAPERLTTLLHEYFTEMTDEILATDGVVDKFIGDAIMAFWGAPIEQPDQADRAVKAAERMVKKLERLRKKWEAEGYPTVAIGVGIHSGEATVGNMGSAKRFDYTVIGDDVNIASRLEGLNKEYGTSIIISETTKQQLKRSVPTKRLGEVKVKGKTQAVTIYTLGEK